MLVRNYFFPAFKNTFLSSGVILGCFFTGLSLISSWLSLLIHNLWISFAITIIFLNIAFIAIQRFKHKAEALAVNFFGILVYAVLALFIIFGSLRIYAVLHYGDNSWDANSQHIPMALSIFQTNSIFPKPQNLTIFQYYPAVTQTIGALFSYVFGNIASISLMQVPWLISSCLIWFGWIIEKYPNSQDKKHRDILVLAIFSSAPLIFSFGVGYVDFAVAWGLSIMLWFITDSQKNTSRTQSVAVCGLAVAAVITGKMAVWESAALLAIICLIKTWKVSKTSFSHGSANLLVFALSTLLGCVYLLRNFIKFRNFFYPGPDFFHRGIDGPLNSDFVIGMLRNSDYSSINHTDHFYAFFWNWLISLKDWLVASLQFKKSDLGLIYSHDARIVGNGVGISFLILTITIAIFIKSVIRFETRKISIFLLIIISGLLIPEPASMRYMWGLTIPFVIILLNELRMPMILRNLKILVMALVAVSFIGTSFAAASDFKERIQISKVSNLGAYFPQVEGHLNLDEIRCAKVHLVGDIPSFTSELWLRQTCTHVDQYDNIQLNKSNTSPKDIFAFMINATNFDKKCLISLNFAIINSRWGTNESTVVYVQGSKDALKVLDCYKGSRGIPRY